MGNELIYVVVDADGYFCGVPCLSEEEAMLLSNEHAGSEVYFCASLRKMHNYLDSLNLPVFETTFYDEGRGFIRL